MSYGEVTKLNEPSLHMGGSRCSQARGAKWLDVVKRREDVEAKMLASEGSEVMLTWHAPNRLSLAVAHAPRGQILRPWRDHQPRERRLFSTTTPT
jgi:hypothetical protein